MSEPALCTSPPGNLGGLESGLRPLLTGQWVDTAPTPDRPRTWPGLVVQHELCAHLSEAILLALGLYLKAEPRGLENQVTCLMSTD